MKKKKIIILSILAVLLATVLAFLILPNSLAQLRPVAPYSDGSNDMTK